MDSHSKIEYKKNSQVSKSLCALQILLIIIHFHSTAPLNIKLHLNHEKLKIKNQYLDLLHIRLYYCN